MKAARQRLLGNVRFRVTAAALLALACALTFFGAGLDASLQHNRQRTLQNLADQQAKEVMALNPKLQQPLILPPYSNIQSGLVQVLIGDKVIGASRVLRHLPPLIDGDAGSGSVITADLSALAKDVHEVSVPVNSGSVHGTVVVIISLEQYDHSVALVQRLLEIGIPILLAVFGAICWLMVSRALRPIDTMRREVDEVAVGHLSYRVPEPANDDEVGRLARTLNQMLDRIEASSRRERRFVSDASHELRSPIANIRTELEVALHHPAVADWPQIAGDVLSENDRMEQLVAGLLLLARSDEGSLIVAREAVNLADVVAEVVRHYPPRAARLRVRSEPAMITVPAVYAERMVSNLVDNARRFAEQTVDVISGTEGDCVVLRVRDDGPGVPADDRHRIFERFVRLDEARDRGEGGFGLGLAIVADLSRFYGGSIEVHDAGPGAEFVLRLPAAAPAPARPPAEEPAPVAPVG